MKKINKAVAVATALILSSTLAACGEKADTAATEVGEAAEATGDAVAEGADDAMNTAEKAADATAEAAGDAAAANLELAQVA